MIGFLLAAVPALAPSPLFAPTSAPISERAVLEDDADSLEARAKALGATLGVAIVDVITGAATARDGDANLPMAGVQRLPLAIVALHAVDAGHLTLNQSVGGVTLRDLVSRTVIDNDYAAANGLIGLLGGGDAVNAQLRALGLDAIFVAADDMGYATPDALAHLLTNVANGGLLAPATTKLLLNDLKSMHSTHTETSTNDARILFVNRRTVVVVAMLNGGAGGDEARDAIVAAAAQAAIDATAANP